MPRDNDKHNRPPRGPRRDSPSRGGRDAKTGGRAGPGARKGPGAQAGKREGQSGGGFAGKPRGKKFEGAGERPAKPFRAKASGSERDKRYDERRRDDGRQEGKSFEGRSFKDKSFEGRTFEGRRERPAGERSRSKDENRFQGRSSGKAPRRFEGPARDKFEGKSPSRFDSKSERPKSPRSGGSRDRSERSGSERDRSERSGSGRSGFERGGFGRSFSRSPDGERPRPQRKPREADGERFGSRADTASGGRASGSARTRDRFKPSSDASSDASFKRPRAPRKAWSDESEAPRQARGRFDEAPRRPARRYESDEAAPRRNSRREGERERPYKQDREFKPAREFKQSREFKQDRGYKDAKPRFDARRASSSAHDKAASYDRDAPRTFNKTFNKTATKTAPKTGERIAKVLARVGLCSRRDAEEWIAQGRISVNGRIINSPALNITPRDKIAIDGEPMPERERTRLFIYHKPRGLVTTHSDPEGRTTVFDALPADLPRLISVGRLDYNTEGLLLLTNDGGLARVLELPETGWLRRYRVRAFGEIDQAQLDGLRKGIEVDGVRYGEVDAMLDRKQGDNCWLTFAIREGKNREVRNVLRALGLEVNRLIRLSYGPFQLEDLAEGEVREIRPSVLREQLGERLIAKSGADLTSPLASEKPVSKRGSKEDRTTRAGLIADRKGRRILVERTLSADDESSHGKGRASPKRGHINRSYHGKPQGNSARPSHGKSDKPPAPRGPGKRGR